MEAASCLDCYDQAVVRRSGNYKSNVWDKINLLSLRSEYLGEAHKSQAEKLKGDVRIMLEKADDALDRLELLDKLQRLGLAYHFEEEINNIIHCVYLDSENIWKREDLYSTALQFRLLRHHGYSVSQEVFASFEEKRGCFKECLQEDVKGMLSLYEASYHSFEDEGIMEEAWKFATKYLKQVGEDVDPNLMMQVTHTLELPLHWRAPWFEARWSINMYEGRGVKNPIVEFAKLNFNIVQGIHQKDLGDMLRWWKNIALKDKLSFARDRLVESFLWTLGGSFQPQFNQCRRILTKTIALITVIDDMYDVYGTLDELILFTDAVDRWDINAVKHLPEYMRISFLALFNTVNKMAYDILIEHGLDVTSNLKKKWADLCKTYLVEAMWYHSGYKPTLEEYMNNAWISVGAPMVLFQSFLFATNPITQEQIEYLENIPDILRLSSMIGRFVDDFGTSTEELKRGDVPKSIQCYMHETGVSEDAAREHIRDVVIRGMWKKVNKYRVMDSPIPPTSIERMLNIVRMSHCIYQHGDGHAGQGREARDLVISSLVESVPLLRD